MLWLNELAIFTLAIFTLDNTLEIGKMSFIPAKKLFSKNN
jgi:hypothetical protein